MTAIVRYGRAAIAEATALAELFLAVVAPLDIYNDAARVHEIASHGVADFERLIGNDPASVLVARLDGQVVGFAITEDEHGPVWIDWYGVSPSARGLGIGDGLIGFVVAESRRRGATRVWCDTRTVNTASNAILAKHGFRQLCELPNHWHGQDFLLWERSPL